MSRRERNHAVRLRVESSMRPVLTFAIAAAIHATASASHAQTDMSRVTWYPWCGISCGANTEHRSCGFVSYEQCMNAVRPKNDMCFENIWGPGPAEARRSDESRRRKR